MLTLTPEEQKEARLLKLQGKSTQEVASYLSGKRVGAPTSLSIQRKEPSQASSFAQDIGGDLFDFAKGAVGAFQRTGTDINEIVQDPNASLTQKTVGTGMAIARTPLDIVGEGIFAAGKAALPESAEQFIGDKFSSGVEAAAETDTVQNVMSWYDTLPEADKFNIERIILPGAEIVSEGSTGGIFGRLLGKGKRAVPDLRGEVQTAVSEAQRGNVAPVNRIVQATIPEAERTQLVDTLARSYEDTILSNRTSVTGKLDDLATANSFGGNRVTRQDILKEFAEQGYVPVINGQLSDFTDAIDDLSRRQTKLMEDLEPVIARTKEEIDKADFIEQTRAAINDNPQFIFGSGKASSDLDGIFADLRFGDRLTATDINNIRKIANDRSRSFRKANDDFQADVWYMIGDTARRRLDDMVPEELARRTNAEYGRMEKLKRVADILDGQRIDVGLIGRTLGSYIGTVLASTAGLSVGGPGGLVIAGVASNLGQDWLADAIRRRIFNPKTQEQLRTVLQQDDKLRNELLDRANEQDKQTLSQFLLAAPDPNAPRSEVTGGRPIEVGGQTPDGRVEPGITERAREGAVRQPEGEPRQSEVERALREDDEAVRQAVAEMEAELSGDVRTSRGENIVQTEEGRYRFNELPSWIPEELRDGGLMERVMDNIVNGKKPRANAVKEQELQNLVEARMKTRIDELKKGKGDTGIFSGDTAFAAALMAGGSYFLFSDEGNQLFPVVAIGSMLASPMGRKGAVASAKKMAAKGKKLPESYKRKIAEALEEYDAGFFDVKENGATRSIAPDEVDLRIAELQEKNAAGSLTNKDALEAEELMANKGILLSPDDIEQPRNPDGTYGKKPQSATTKTTDLLEEARKYKSADEFVKAQGEPVFQGVAADVNKINADRGEIYFTTSKRAAENYSEDASFAKIKRQGIKEGNPKYYNFWDEDGRLKKKINEAVAPQLDNPLIVDAKSAEWDEIATPSEMGSKGTKTTDQITKWAKNNGYDGVIFKNLTDAGLYETSTDYVVFDPTKIKTRVELESLWKEANK